jgi:CelD/BcsL family acetyltransferase involved in cellulose biosynthesis
VTEVAKITDAESLARLRPEWEALWRRDPAATPFQSPAWLLAWWQFFGTAEPLMLTARDDGDLVGLLPLYLLRDGDRRKLLPIGVGLSDYIGALLDPAMSAIADLFTATIAETAGWDEFWLPDVMPERVPGATRLECGLAARIEAAAPCPVLALPHGGAALAASVPRKTLRDLRQARARSLAAGGVVVETSASDARRRHSSPLMPQQLREQRARRPGRGRRPGLRHHDRRVSTGFGP